MDPRQRHKHTKNREVHNISVTHVYLVPKPSIYGKPTELKRPPLKDLLSKGDVSKTEQSLEKQPDGSPEQILAKQLEEILLKKEAKKLKAAEVEAKKLGAHLL